ncbi:beta-glucosidase [Bombiscardovia apis]|uniref:Beta-glucosidase n=1 Tax=Bombiscardovia apis TaxID=2932182 RepID=A0ABM8BAT5_9BIFI|nr:glycoside hydrolase family 3 protein [Bombiscardovia apis]BDR53907.1 beta-glucosidase [Bombiscardovia apis]
MLDINMSDVFAVLKSLIPEFVAIGVLLILAIIATIAVNKRTVKQVANRKLIHSESWIVALTGTVVAVSLMLTGPMATIMDNTSVEKRKLSDTTVAAANTLAEETQNEAITLLKNEDSALPLSAKKINVFGWSSTNPVYGGSGSGSISDQYPTVSLLEGMKKAGLQTNSELSSLYTKYNDKRPKNGMFEVDWSLPELPVEQYPSKAVTDAKNFSDQAIVVIARVGGEGSDLPTNMKAKNVTYTDNSKQYPDFKEGEHYLQLSQSERNMLDMVTKDFSKVTLVYNGANTFQFDFLQTYPQIKSVVWCPPAGQNGFTSLGRVLTGKLNPSGKTSDTFIKDLKQSPTWNNFGDFAYDNVTEFKIKSEYSGLDVEPHFVNYSEGIYVGYRFYETAAKEGIINYDDMVLYPFGYGLSYTKFEQKMGPLIHKDSKISFDVSVTNTGSKAGKDVVESYYSAPYTDGGIEKASTNLVAFEKTKLLQPGESQTITVSFNESDMASYDEHNAKSYVLEEGDYTISIQSDSHHALDSKNVTIDKSITYDGKGSDKLRTGDKKAATNLFDSVRGDNVTYLSRAGHFANYAKATAAPASMSMSDSVKARFVNNGNYDPKKFDKASDKMPTTGAKNGVTLSDLYGKSYDDPLWDELLDQLSVKDMDNLIANGGFGTSPVKSIGKPKLIDADGPAALNNNFTKIGSIGFPSSTALACTWNTELARRFGDMIGQMAHDMGITGWYAPAMNMHRSAFGGRNFEYFSEDGLLAGTMASNEVGGAQKHGVYAYMKHLALNDQETNRTNMLCTWADEQAMREIFLRPFEMSVKDGGATGAMSGFNYLGSLYCGANSDLLKKLLRNEWGFRGTVVTDYFGNYDLFQNADQEIRNGNDLMLATLNVTNHVSDQSATSVKAMREACHNILYTTGNSWMYADGSPKVKIPAWRMAMYAVWALTVVLVIWTELVALKRFKARRKAADLSVLEQVADNPIEVELTSQPNQESDNEK